MPVKHGPKGMVAKVADDTITIWTFDYEIDHPIETKCAASEFGYPNFDYDGRTMFENTHFRTEREAWEKLIVETTAGQSLRAATYEESKRAFTERTQLMADAAARVVRVRYNFDAWERDRDLSSESEGSSSGESST